MKSLINVLLLGAIVYSSANALNGSTTSAVTLAGGIIKAKHLDESNKKYKRKDCPVCKGKGWYLSGDGIKKVDCGYCEPDAKQEPECKDGQCEVPQNPTPNLPPRKSIIIRR